MLALLGLVACACAVAAIAELRVWSVVLGDGGVGCLCFFGVEGVGNAGDTGGVFQCRRWQ